MKKLFWFAKFVGALKRFPEDDDLERVMCDYAGESGHLRCGWCDEHKQPQFACDHFAKVPKVLRKLRRVPR